MGYEELPRFCFKDLLIHCFKISSFIGKIIHSGGRYCALSRSVSERPVIGFVRTGSPVVAVAWPVSIESRNKCNHVSSSYNKHARPPKESEGGKEAAMCPGRAPSSVRADVAYLRALRRRFAPARVKSVLLPVPRVARDTAGYVQRSYLPRVVRNLRALPLPRVRTIMYPNWRARSLVPPPHRSRSLRSSGLPSSAISIGNIECIYGRDIAVIMKLVDEANVIYYSFQSFLILNFSYNFVNYKELNQHLIRIKSAKKLRWRYNLTIQWIIIPNHRVKKIKIGIKSIDPQVCFQKNIKSSNT